MRHSWDFLKNGETRAVDVTTETLDEALRTEKDIELMKIDAEGFELNIIDGGDTTLDKVKNIIIETSPSTQRRCWEALEHHGFSVSMLDGSAVTGGNLLRERGTEPEPGASSRKKLLL